MNTGDGFVIVPILIFLLLIFFLVVFSGKIGGSLPNLFEKTALFKNPKTGQYEERKIDEKGNIIYEEEQKEVANESIQTIDKSKQDLVIAKIIKKEIDRQNYNEVTWLKAFKKAKGNKQETQALYAEYRFQQLEDEFYEKINPKENKLIDVQFKKTRSGSYNFFSENKFLSGQETLATAFWLYSFSGSLVVGFIVGLFSVLVGIWAIIFLICYLIFSIIGLWKCADTYTNEMQRKRKSYGWAIAAKVYVIINALIVPAQIISLIKV